MSGKNGSIDGVPVPDEYIAKAQGHPVYRQMLPAMKVLAKPVVAEVEGVGTSYPCTTEIVAFVDEDRGIGCIVVARKKGAATTTKKGQNGIPDPKLLFPIVAQKLRDKDAWQRIISEATVPNPLCATA